jgi:rhodanese-related sulfurtransferase
MKHSPGFLRLVNDAKQRVQEISVQEVQRSLERGDDFVFVDTREEHEWHEAHAAGATFLSKGVIERDIEKTIPDKRKRIVLYCGGGYRSVLVADNLQKMGYKNVVSMAGGWRAWKTAGGPIETSRLTYGESVFPPKLGVMEPRIAYGEVVRSGNPFTPMTGIEPSVFGGRILELKFFEERIQRALTNYCEHFLVLGNWGIGKSTLFKEYKRSCQDNGYLASVVPLEAFQPGTKLIEAARSIVEGMLRDLPFGIQKFKKLTEFFDSVGIDVLGTGLNFSRDTSKKELSPQAFLHDTFLHLWQDVKSKTDVFVLLLDDLDNFSGVSEIVMTLKQTLSMDTLRKTRILVGISSTPGNWLSITSMAKHHPLSRYFLSRIELSPLSESEFSDTIAKSLRRTGVSIEPNVVTKVYEYTGGHPFEMQVLCYHLFSNHLGRTITLDVWDKALLGAINDLGRAVFDNWYAQASGEEAKVLRLVAEGGCDMSAREVQGAAKKNKVKVSRANVAKYLRRLAEKGLLTKSARGLFSISDPMFRMYVKTRNE